jgi:hypothetical protein
MVASAVFFCFLAVIKRYRQPNPRGYNRVDVGHDIEIELSMLFNDEDST